MAWELCEHYFGQRANIHHYLGITKGALDSLDAENMIKIKKLFYVLRPLLASSPLPRQSFSAGKLDEFFLEAIRTYDN